MTSHNDDSKEKTKEELFWGTLESSLKKKLSKCGVHRTIDLVFCIPYRYEDQTHITLIRDAPLDHPCLVDVVIEKSTVLYGYKRQLICSVKDESGTLMLRFLNFNEGMRQNFTSGERYYAFGKLRKSSKDVLEMIHPKMRKPYKRFPEHLTPVYSKLEGISYNKTEKLITTALQISDLSDTIPRSIRSKFHLLNFQESIEALHYAKPSNSLVEKDRSVTDDLRKRAIQRLKLDEWLAYQLLMRQQRDNHVNRNACLLKKKPNGLAQHLWSTLPFEPTHAQNRVVDEISSDLQKKYPMLRLLHGDVGSGKTIVAAFACLQAIDNDKSSALMAPTEVLAEQHFLTLEKIMRPMGVHCVLLTSSVQGERRQKALQKLASSQAKIAIGTHALLQKGVQVEGLSLVVVDEQHRFGVEQRSMLLSKGVAPHLLMMSATPIPRTLSLGFMSDMDISVLDERPHKRKSIKTKILISSRRKELLKNLSSHPKRQTYWVCPLVEESEKIDLQAATSFHQSVQKEFPNLNACLVHGKMKSSEKQKAINAFRSGEIGLLIATTIIEVGIDAPNADIIVIEHAERFGLSQLHQLRGRVGRGDKQGYCFLLYEESLSGTALERLKIIHRSEDGFEIAKQDLRLRGPGFWLGTSQAGLPPGKFINTAQEGELKVISYARKIADIMQKYDPETVRQHVTRWIDKDFSGRFQI